MFALYTGTGITAITGIYSTSDGDSANTASHTHSLTFGTPFTGRRLVFAISWRGNNSRTISSVRVDPTGLNLACTIHLNQSNGGGITPGVAIVSVEEATLSGLTDVDINFSGITGTGSRVYTSLYELTSCTASNGATAISSNAVTSTVNATYGSYVISVCFAYNISGTVAWTNATEDLEQSVDGASFKHVVAHESMTATDSTFDTTATASTSASHMRIGTYVFTPN